ncbi:SCO family protein [Qipengyuania sp. ASV99]|uniref:SCO family protein n=1 Tax=Qipengyuania sp. ASV99 TaxID=3399681 RepID=UPI003A4C5C4D
MNISANPSRRFASLARAGLIVGAACLLLAACSPEPSAAIDPPLAGASIGGEFDLVDSEGKAVRWGDFAGKYRIVYFGYAYCPDVCPTDMQRMVQGLNQFAEAEPDQAAKIQSIFITIDPERDHGAVLKEFTSAFSDDVIGLTGTPEQIADAASAFKVFYSRGETAPGGGYLMDHSNVVYLFGPEGEPIATLPTDQGADAVTAELALWVN